MLSTINGELEECLNGRPETEQPREYLNASPLAWIRDCFLDGGVEVSGCGGGDGLVVALGRPDHLTTDMAAWRRGLREREMEISAELGLWGRGEAVWEALWVSLDICLGPT